ncbi:hypothetical protein OUZ56_010697 [Daphnia magna]|uniref:Uncharacterized protein n=1 Tax=Daphnia magna TaxID=35525 RepID=A0ABQ9YYC4_9CRUS|nr:hypothetical protein OUZ56_010697 [Daphnia magna]
MASSGDSDEPQDDSFSSDEETFQVGRIQQFWKGTYNEILPEVGSHPLGGNSSSEVKFFIVTTLECGEDRIQRQVHSIIPTGWISSNMEYLLYPQPRFTVGGKSPIDWGEKTFRRFQIPFESWMEYDIHAILNQTKVVKFTKAIKAAKAAANGQPILSDAFISDSDRILGRGLRKAAQKRPLEEKVSGKGKERRTNNNSLIETPSSSSNLNPAVAIRTQSLRSCQSNTPFDFENFPTNLNVGACVGNITTNSELVSLNNSSMPVSNAAVPAPHGSSGDGSNILRPSVIPSPQPRDVGTRTEAALCGAINKASGMVNNGAPLPSTSHVQDEEEQNRNNIDIQGSNALPSISQTQTRGHGAYLNGTQNNDVITRSTNIGVGHHDKELESPPSFPTCDEFTRLDAVYTRSLNRHNDTPLSWANGGDLLQLNGYQSSQAFSSFDVQTLMRAIEQVEKKLDGLGSTVIEKLDSVSKRMEESFKNDLPLKATKHANYHRWIVESNFGIVSCDTVEKLIATNTALSDKTIAISMVFFISERYKASKSIGAFVNQAYRLFLCDETSQKMQWRSVGRVNDLRPGLSGLMNMLSVIGVALDIFNLSRNTANVDHRRLIEMIKNCRKYNAKNYRKKNNVPGALETDASADAPQLPNANDDSDAVILYNYMTILEKEVVNFRPPPAFARAPDLCN